MAFLALEKLINLHDGYRKRIKIDNLDVLLMQEGEDVCIIDSRCPHQEHSLYEGDVSDGLIYCPRHGYGFDLKTGRHDGGTCGALRVYPVVFEGSQVGISMPPS